MTLVIREGEGPGAPAPGGREARKQETHERILASAADLIRERGLEGTSVADVMSGAGLTVGGFYAHFEDKTALLADGLRAALIAAHRGLMKGIVAAPGPERIRRALGRYLTRRYRDAPTDACPLPAVLTEVPRQGPAVRDVIAWAVEGWVRSMTADVGGERAGAKGSRRARSPHRAAALRALAMSVGAMTLARALGPGALSDELLKAAREVDDHEVGGGVP